MNQFVQIDDIALPAQPPVSEILNHTATVYAHRERAEINAGAIVGMCNSLCKQGQVDVSQSLLFAQLAADASRDKFAERREWTDHMVEVLEMIGWRTLQETSHGQRSLDQAQNWRALAATAFEKGYGGPCPLVTRTLNAVTAMGKRSAGAKLWNGHTAAGTQGMFLLGYVNSDGSGDPVLFLMPASFDVNIGSRGILDWEGAGHWSDDFLVLTLDSDVYAAARDQVTQRLGLRVSTDIDKIAL